MAQTLSNQNGSQPGHLLYAKLCSKGWTCASEEKPKSWPRELLFEWEGAHNTRSVSDIPAVADGGQSHRGHRSRLGVVFHSEKFTEKVTFEQRCGESGATKYIWRTIFQAEGTASAGVCQNGSKNSTWARWLMWREGRQWTEMGDDRNLVQVGPLGTAKTLALLRGPGKSLGALSRAGTSSDPSGCYACGLWGYRGQWTDRR